MHRSTTLLILAALAPPLSSQIQSLVREGDVLPDGSAVTEVQILRVDDDGLWRAKVRTDHPDTALNHQVVGPEGVLVAEGDTVAAVPGSVITSIIGIEIDGHGRTFWTLGIHEAGQPTQVLLRDDQLVLRKGDILASVGMELAGVQTVVPNSVDQILFAGAFGPDSPPHQALLVLDLEPDGSVGAEELILQTGDVPPGQTGTSMGISTGSQALAFNDAGDVMFYTGIYHGGLLLTDGAIYKNDQVLAQFGGPNPIGTTWNTIAAPELDLNEAGEYVMNGSIDAPLFTNFLMVKNGAKLTQAGDVPPGLDSGSLLHFGLGPFEIGADGRALYYAEWSGLGGSNTGLFLDDHPVVLEGVTEIDGQLVDEIAGFWDRYDVSPDGRYMVFEAILADGLDGAHLIDLGGVALPMLGCFGNLGALAHTAGTPRPGEAFTLQLDDPQGVGVLPTLAISTNTLGTAPCGFLLPGFGELFVDFSPPNPVLLYVGPFTTDLSPHDVPLAVPEIPSLSGVTIYAQGDWFDAALVTGTTFQPTNGLEIVIGH